MEPLRPPLLHVVGPALVYLQRTSGTCTRFTPEDGTRSGHVALPPPPSQTGAGHSPSPPPFIFTTTTTTSITCTKGAGLAPQQRQAMRSLYVQAECEPQGVQLLLQRGHAGGEAVGVCLQVPVGVPGRPRPAVAGRRGRGIEKWEGGG